MQIAGGGPSSEAHGQRAVALFRLKVALLLCVMYGGTFGVSCVASRVLGTWSLTEARIVVVLLHCVHLLISYVVMKIIQWFFSKKSWANSVLPILCLVTNNLAAIPFSTGLDFIAVRETLYVPCILFSTMPYLVFCCARRRENITIMWSTVVVTAYFALLLYSVDKDGWIPLPGQTALSSYAAAQLTVVFLVWDLLMSVEPTSGTAAKIALQLCADATMDGTRRFAITVACLPLLRH